MESNKPSTIFESAIKSFLEPIWPLLQDENVTEVMVNSHQEIWVEKGGKVYKENACFADEDSLRAAANNIAQSVGRKIDDSSPRLDARLPNGYRIHVVIPPCARKGTTMAIRKFSSKQFTFEDYIRLGVFSFDSAKFLDICMKLGKNILVSGGTGSGKTTLLSVLCNHIPKGQRIIVIEDVSELKIEYDHVVFFETRMADESGKGAVGIQDLLKSALRLRPDRIIVGEVRGGEALELVQAMNTGHKGCLGTVHANSPHDAIVRLEALAQGADSQLSEKALQHQIGAAVDIIVQVSRFQDGSRRVSAIGEVLGVNDKGIYEVYNLYSLDRLIKNPDGTFSGRIQPCGVEPSFMREIIDHQFSFPKEKFRKPNKINTVPAA